MIEELIRVLKGVRGNASIRGITIRGNGGVFCAGGDIKGFKAVFQGEAGDEASVAAANSRAGELFELIDTMPQVVVMLAEGAAIAGGLGMLCAADIVVVTRGHKIRADGNRTGNSAGPRLRLSWSGASACPQPGRSC